MPLDFNNVGEIHRKTRVGCDHSYTVEETRATGEVQKYLLLSKLRGDTLTDYTKPDWYYCIVEDGSIFKYNPKGFSFYQLDLKRFVWIPNQHFASVIYDTYLRYQEIAGFRDYFPHEECILKTIDESETPDSKKVPEVAFSFRGEAKPGEIEELIAKRNKIFAEMGLLPPDENHESW